MSNADKLGAIKWLCAVRMYPNLNTLFGKAQILRRKRTFLPPNFLIIIWGKKSAPWLTCLCVSHYSNQFMPILPIQLVVTRYWKVIAIFGSHPNWCGSWTSFKPQQPISKQCRPHNLYQNSDGPTTYIKTVELWNNSCLVFKLCIFTK